MSGPKKPLPHGWVVQVSKSYPGHVYYYNTITKCTTWDLPIASENGPRPPSPKEKPKNYFIADIEPDTCSESSSALVIDETASVRSSLALDSKTGAPSQEEFGKTSKAPFVEKASAAEESVEVPKSFVPLKPALKDPSVIHKPKNIGVSFSKEKQLRIIPARTTADSADSLESSGLQFNLESMDPEKGRKSSEFQPPKHIFTKPPNHTSVPVSSRLTSVDPSGSNSVSPDLPSQSNQRSGYKIPKKIQAAAKEQAMNNSPLLFTERPNKSSPKLETQQKMNISKTTDPYDNPLPGSSTSHQTRLFLESECSLYSELPAPKSQASNPQKMLSEEELYPDSDTIEYNYQKPTRSFKSTSGSDSSSKVQSNHKLGSPDKPSRKRRAQRDPTTPPNTSMRVDFASALIRIPNNKENSDSSPSSSSNTQESHELKRSLHKSARLSNPSSNSGHLPVKQLFFKEPTTTSQSGELPESSKPSVFGKFPSFDSLTQSSFLGPKTSFNPGLKPLNSEKPNVFQPSPSLENITSPFAKSHFTSQFELSTSKNSTSNQTVTKPCPTFDSINDTSSRHSNDSSSTFSRLGPPPTLNPVPSVEQNELPSLLETTNYSASKQLDVTDLRMKLDCKRLLSNKSTFTDSSKSMLFSERFDDILFDSDMPNMKFTSIPEPTTMNSFNFGFNPSTPVMTSANLSNAQSNSTPNTWQVTTPVSLASNSPISQPVNTPLSQSINTPVSTTFNKSFNMPISSSFGSPVINNTESCKPPTKRLNSLPVPKPQAVLQSSGTQVESGNTSANQDATTATLKNTSATTQELLSKLPAVETESRIRDWQIPSPSKSPVAKTPSESAQSERSFGDYWASKEAVDEMEEAMDWEAENSLLSPPASKVSAPTLDNLDDMYKHLQHKAWHIVVDTNIFIYHLDFLTEVRDTPYKDRGLPTIVFPYVVFQELDGLKDRNRRKEKKGDKIDQAIVNKVHAAISFINTNLNSEHPRFLGQSLGEHLQHEEAFKGSVNNDDRILHFCSTLQKKGIQVSLLTDDKNLRSKALSSRIEAMSKTDLQKLGKVAKVAEMVIAPPSPPDSNKEKPMQHNMEATRAEKIYCQTKVILSDVLKDVLQKGMQAEFKTLWSRLIIKKPPWTLDDLVYCIKYHWMSVFGNKLPKTSLELITDIEDTFHKYKMKKGFSHTHNDMGTFVEICIQLVVSFHKLNFVNDKVKAAAQKLTQLKDLCSHGDSLSSQGSINQQLHLPSLCDTPKSMTSCENSCNDPEWSEVKTAQTEELQLKSVHQHLQAIFEKVNVFCDKLESLEQISTQNPALLDTIEKDLSPNHRFVKLFLQLNDKILDKTVNKSSKEISELHGVLSSENFDVLEQEGFDEPFSRDALTLYYQKNQEILKTAQEQFKNFNKKLNTGVRFFMARAAI